MAISKVIFNGDTLMDVTGDNPASDNMLTGTRATGANGQTVNGAVVTAPASTDNPAMDGTASPGSDDTYSRGDHVHPTDTSRAPTSHAASTTTYGAGTSSNYGHLRLSDSTSSTSGTSGGYAATPSAVKSVKDSIPSASTTSPKMDGTASYGSGTTWARADHVHPTDTGRAPTSHASSATTYGTGTSSNYGHLKLSDSTSSTSSTSGGIAATPAAVKAAYDLANSKQDPATTLAGYGITDAASSAELGTFVRPNLLDNWFFVGGGQFPINQRGATSYNASGYAIDRWNKTTGTSATLVLTASGLTASGANAYLRQSVENKSGLVGKTITCSVLTATGGLFSHTAVLQSGKKFDFDGTAVTLSDISTTYPDELFGIYATTTDTLIAVKAEIGPSQTLAHWDETTQAWVLNEIPNYQQELARCQRYYWQPDDSATYAQFGIGIATSATNANIQVKPPVPMRIAPSLIFTSGSERLRLRVGGTGGISVTDLSLAGSTATPTMFLVKATASGLTTGETAVLYRATQSPDSFAFSADL